MAEARVEQKTRIVVESETVVLTLTKSEAQTLQQILGKIGGVGPRRADSESMNKALSAALGNVPVFAKTNNGNPGQVGTIYFGRDDDTPYSWD